MLVYVNVCAFGKIDYTHITFWRNREIQKTARIKFFDTFICEEGQEIKTAKENLKTAYDDLAEHSARYSGNSIYIGDNFYLVDSCDDVKDNVIYGNLDGKIHFEDSDFKIRNIVPIKNKSMKWCFENMTSEMFIKEFGNISIKDLTN